MTRKGFLLVLMHPPTAFEEEFNAWYDSEHVPERLAVPGFESGLRYISVSGAAPRYLAIYDLAAPEVMESPDYLRVAHERSSPWTKRVTARARVQRFAGTQVYPGDRVTGRAARIGLLRFRGLREGDADAVVAGMRDLYEGRPEVRQVRVLAQDSGTAGTDVLGVVEAAAPLPDSFDPRVFGDVAGALDLVGSYTPF
ncbi:hypothetical protein LPC08_20720 [Roseomonas sp. OT10]|uniref:DUF4286 family protein n=1 Tax=Roseomonas cutis TaxID=2897332 RepID=UPI001E604C36|nr:DUF4286 family protein [Roseomonas sp. OT10]UFN48411.1 hypothetical protein LPC08_20720 [Roseomonas sp. OT10]